MDGQHVLWRTGAYVDDGGVTRLATVELSAAGLHIVPNDNLAAIVPWFRDDYTIPIVDITAFDPKPPRPGLRLPWERFVLVSTRSHGDLLLRCMRVKGDVQQAFAALGVPRATIARRRRVSGWKRLTTPGIFLMVIFTPLAVAAIPLVTTQPTWLLVGCGLVAIAAAQLLTSRLYAPWWYVRAGLRPRGGSRGTEGDAGAG